MITEPISNIDRIMVICEVADVSALELAIGKTITTPLYTASDAVPRTQTHTYTAYKASQSTPALTTAHVADLNAAIVSFPTAVIEKYNASSQRTYVADRLLDLGLTTNSGSI